MITKEKIRQSFDAVCYHYCGTRWQDIGLLDNALRAFIYLFAEYPTISVKGERIGSESVSGAYRNVANSHEYSLIYIEKKDGSIVDLNVEWHQLGGAKMKFDGEIMMDAVENYGSWKLEISDKFIELLNDLISL
jgi:hypothetical protein